MQKKFRLYNFSLGLKACRTVDVMPLYWFPLISYFFCSMQCRLLIYIFGNIVFYEIIFCAWMDPVLYMIYCWRQVTRMKKVQKMGHQIYLAFTSLICFICIIYLPSISVSFLLLCILILHDWWGRAICHQMMLVLS